MSWITLPTPVGRQAANLFAALLPDIEADRALRDLLARSPALRRIVFLERRRLPGSPSTSLLCRPFSYDLGVLREIWDDAVYDGRVELKSEDTVMDLGAHGGYFTALAATLVGPRGRVIAVEPAPENLRLLTENVRRNHLRNVRIVAAAAAQRAGRSRLYLSSGLTGHSLVTPRTPHRLSVIRTTVDRTAAREAPRGDIALVKIDAEAAELTILHGARQTLPRIRAVVAACYHTKDEVRQVRNFLIRHGFTTSVRDGIVVGRRRPRT